MASTSPQVNTVPWDLIKFEMPEYTWESDLVGAARKDALRLRQYTKAAVELMWDMQVR
jgi:hypothetical protein